MKGKNRNTTTKGSGEASLFKDSDDICRGFAPSKKVSPQEQATLAEVGKVLNWSLVVFQSVFICIHLWLNPGDGDFDSQANRV